MSGESYAWKLVYKFGKKSKRFHRAKCLILMLIKAQFEYLTTLSHPRHSLIFYCHHLSSREISGKMCIKQIVFYCAYNRCQPPLALAIITYAFLKVLVREWLSQSVSRNLKISELIWKHFCDQLCLTNADKQSKSKTLVGFYFLETATFVILYIVLLYCMISSSVFL